MKDTYGRAIDYMRLSITDRCNLRCRYCMPQGIELVPMERILTYEQILQIGRAAARAGIRKFKVTGGEPLVRIGCPQLIGSLKQIPGIEQVTMTTNGVLLKKYLPELVENGLDAVNVSLDTLDAEVYRQITGFDQLGSTLEGIDAALEAGLRVKINCVPQKDVNDEACMELAKLTLDRPLDVRFIEMMPIGFGKEYQALSNEELLAALQKKFEGVSPDPTVHGNGPAVYYKIPGAQGSVGFISAIHGKFCADCNRIRLTSQGKIKPCLCFGESVDLWEILKENDPAKREEELLQAILKAVRMKPQSHKFETMSEITEEKRMIEIGG